MSLRRVLGFVLASALFALPACGSLPTGKVPVDNPLNEFEPPEEGELTGEGGDAWGDDDWDDDEPEAAPEPAAAVDPASGDPGAGVTE